MQKSIITRKLIPFIIVLFAVVLVAMAFGLANAFGVSAADNKGEGNNAGDVNKTADIELILDVNGRDASNPALSSLNDENYDRANADRNDFEKNNAQHLKVRKISASAVVQVYNAKNDPDKDEGGYHFVDTSIYYDCSEITVTTDTVTNDPTRLIVTANAKTRQQNGVRFSVVLANDAGDSFPMYFQVVVEDTFAQHTVKESGGIKTSNEDIVQMRVGGRVTTDANGNQTENKENDFLVRINNYTVWQFELEEYLVNHALYINADANDTKYTKAIRIAAGNDAPYWMISSVNNFTVGSVQFADGGFADFKSNNPTKDEQHSAAISATLSLSSEKIRAYVAEQRDVDKDYSIDKFWAETHDVLVTLYTVEDDGVNEKRVIIRIPVRFRSDNPQKTTIPSSYLHLTVTSKYICDYNSGSTSYKDADGNSVSHDTIIDEGYGSIIIRPSDLVDYCFPSQMDGRTVRLTFDRSSTDLGSESSDYMLVPEEYEEGMEMYPNAYRVIALKNKQYSINFGIRYYVEGSATGYNTMVVLVAITGDGAYTVVIPTIEGKDAVTYNVMSSSHFKQLRDANYIMTEAVSDNPEQLNVTLTNNELRLKPNVDKIKGTTRATITMTFTNTNGQKLVLTSQE
ncbi:MAG: hypothetical protein K2M48_04355, partial [Clostridiales bacterium]|nr:hypothetical protein [Clostridiales bacterium]